MQKPQSKRGSILKSKVGWRQKNLSTSAVRGPDPFIFASLVSLNNILYTRPGIVMMRTTKRRRQQQPDNTQSLPNRKTNNSNNNNQKSKNQTKIKIAAHAKMIDVSIEERQGKTASADIRTDKIVFSPIYCAPYERYENNCRS